MCCRRNTARNISNNCETPGIDVEAAQRSRQLELALPEHTYLRSGRFDKEAMLALIQEALRAGKTLGFPLTRMIAHAETAVDDWFSPTNGSSARCG
jgi:hypothetical protein